jgi:hypothetical protein
LPSPLSPEAILTEDDFKSGRASSDEALPE